MKHNVVSSEQQAELIKYKYKPVSKLDCTLVPTHSITSQSAGLHFFIYPHP